MSNNLLFYKKLLELPLIPNKTYPLNKENVNKYIAEFDDESKPVIQKIFKITKNISYETFNLFLNSNFRDFINYCDVNKIKNVYLFFGINKIEVFLKNSNFWIAQHFIQYINKYKIDLNIFIIYNKEDILLIKNDDIILILDDCSYTGIQLSNHINYIFFNIKTKLNIYILIPFISENSMNRIKKISFIHKIIFSKYNVIIRPLKYYLNENEEKILLKYKEDLNIDINNNYPIYFDHKLADFASTITMLYIGYVPWKNKVIPVITNCGHVKNFKYDDEYKTVCPPNPYKIKTDKGYNKSLFKKYSSKINDYRKLKIKSLSLEKKVKKPFKSLKSLKTKSSSIKNKLFSPNKQQKFKFNDKLNMLKKPPLIPNQSYPIIKSKLNEFILKYHNEINKKEEEILEKIIDKIYYFSYDTFKKALFKCFDNFIKYYYKNKLTKITIILDISNEYSSSYWVTKHFMQYLMEKSINDINMNIVKDFTNKKTDETYVYFDDCIYNNDMNSPLYKNINFFKTDNTLLIICPYICYEMCLYFESYDNCETFHLVKLLKINLLLTKSQNDYIKKSNYDNILNSTLVYFDHSINRIKTFYSTYDNKHSFIECLIKNEYIPCPYNMYNVKDYEDSFKLYEKTKDTKTKDKKTKDEKIKDTKTKDKKTKDTKTKDTKTKDEKIKDKKTKDMKIKDKKTKDTKTKDKKTKDEKIKDTKTKDEKSKYLKRDLTIDDCTKWKTNKINNPLKPKNPITNYPINPNSPIYKELEKKCK
jgi:hypothetical protein